MDEAVPVEVAEGEREAELEAVLEGKASAMVQVAGSECGARSRQKMGDRR